MEETHLEVHETIKVLYSVPSSVWTVPSLCSWKFWKIPDKFDPRRAVGFDRVRGAIESNCPSGSQISWIFQNFHEHRDGTVHTLDGTEYRNFFEDVHQAYRLSVSVAATAFSQQPWSSSLKNFHDIVNLAICRSQHDFQAPTVRRARIDDGGEGVRQSLTLDGLPNFAK